MHAFTKVLLAAIASGSVTVHAQTFTSCNPTSKSGCPSDPALGKAIEYDFTQGAPSDFSVSTGSAPTFTKEGGVFTIAKKGDAPTITSKWYMMFGHYDIKVKAAPGQGVISSLVLQSDDLDEIDWEWVGSASEEVQTNYYGKGQTTTYDRGKTVAAPGSQAEFHTYSLDWTSEAITWSIDGKTVRTLTPETADKDQYPQSPMMLKIGPWVAGDVGQPQGTVEWAGGLIDWSKAPYVMVVESVKAIDYSTGKSYSYGDMTGDWQSIKSDGGKISGTGDPNAQVSDAAPAGTAVSSAASTQSAAANNAAVANSGSTTATAPSSSGTDKPASSGTVKPASSGTAAGTATGAQTSGSSATAATGSNASAATHNSAARIGGSIGAVAFAAAVMIL